MTSIEWTRGDDGAEGKTWNPTRGCSRVNADCDACYAMRQARRHDYEGGFYEGLTRIGKRGVDWSGEVRSAPDTLTRPLHWKKPRRIFVNSMSDLFHPALSNGEIAAVFGVMALAKQHTYQVLTKRPGRALEWFGWVKERGLGAINDALRVNGIDRVALPTQRHGMVEGGWPLSNVWLGVSAGHQKALDEFVPLLLQCPATVHWLSAEPLWQPIDIPQQYLSRLRWVVVGGESGHGARPFDLVWARNLQRQCAYARTPYFLKQLGAKPVDGAATCVDCAHARGPHPLVLHDKKGGDMEEWPYELRVREFPKGVA